MGYILHFYGDHFSYQSHSLWGNPPEIVIFAIWRVILRSVIVDEGLRNFQFRFIVYKHNSCF